MNVPIEHFLIVSSFMFFAGVYGFIVRKNMLAMLISVELMLNAVVINFCIFNRYLYPGNMDGMFFTMFAIILSAAETVIAIAIIINVYRNIKNIDVKNVNKLKY